MTTLIFVFVAALGMSLLLTPVVRRFAVTRNLVQQPNYRSSHTQARPRIGGIALYLSFFLALVASLPLQTGISILLEDSRYLAIFAGATLMFVTGLIDDLYNLKPIIKLFCQILAGLITWYGGVQITVVSLKLTSGVGIGFLSLPVTLFWIVLVTNAINLIDGLDGLAAGVTLFVSLMMGLLCIFNENYITAVSFLALAGATLGFLRYNFNPASIFMGDSGSYFLGYSIAALSILGSVKGQTTVAMLIPFLALGVPIFDALLSPLRRFISGHKIFSPDHSHLHHKLMESGEGHRTTVLILYTVTIILGAAAFSLVYIRDERAALILLIPAIILFFLFRKIGYLNYSAVDKVYGWLRDVAESSRLSSEGTTFLDHQIEISQAESIDDLWAAATRAFAFLSLDQAILILAPPSGQEQHEFAKYRWNSEITAPDSQAGYRFKVEYPLLNRDAQTVFLGRLIIHQYTQSEPTRQFATRRIEQLQSAITQKISELRLQQSLSCNCRGQQSSHPGIFKN